MTKHRFTFILKYVLLAAAICAVLCFAGVFARYVTEDVHDMLVSVSGFDVDGELYVVDGGTETLVSDSNIPTLQLKNSTESLSFKLAVTNKGGVPVECVIEVSDPFTLTSSSENVSENVLTSTVKESGSSSIDFSLSLDSDRFPSATSGVFMSYSLELTITYNQAE